MTSYSLDVELFIGEVQKYPELWDINCEEYRHKNRKSRAWGEVAKIFIDDYDDLSVREKNDVYRKLFNKWRNIRDSYVRHVKRKYGKKAYLYAKQLSFLRELYKQTTLSGSEGEEHNDDTWASDSEESKLKKILFKSGCFESKEEPLMWQNDDETIDLKRKKRKTDIEFVETNFPEATSSLAVIDEDKSFFDSLLPAVKDFTIDQKLEFRSDIIKLIKNYRKNARSLRLKDESD
ncbi:Uncharacterized protein OBRU01_14845 [Operophtera brumata]|uniref:MADF domain-containing protein n=1 Tax=Operophtera brumata TaxID=104452 RepID=A0A0L7L5Y0_OPEBR|nr:Uncharacterized protein OBRU01_14845 [Operophtera brumata]